MRKKTIKYTIVDLGGTRYVVLRRQLLYITQHIHVDRVSHCKVALLTKTDYDSLNLAISHLHALLGNIRLASITVGPTEADQPDSTSNQ